MSKLKRISNIFDPIEKELDQRVFKGENPRPSVVSFIERKIYSTLEDSWVDDPRQYFKLFLTGSLTTFQYSDSSDCDISLFPDYQRLMELFEEDDPVTIRKDLITIVTSELDGSPIPGSRHPLQDFVVNPGIQPRDLYKAGERSAWSFQTHSWVVPPEHERTHTVAEEMPKAFQRAQDMADKLTVLLDAGEDDAAKDFYAQVHKKRSEDEASGLGDFSEGNIVYKWLLNQGLFDRLNNEAGMHIAKAELWVPHTANEEVKVLYNWEKDEILLGVSAAEHSATVLIGSYENDNLHLYNTYKQFLNANYLKRLWLASFPAKPIHNIYFDSHEIPTRPVGELTYTELLPGLVHNKSASSPWRKGKDWKQYIENTGIIVDFQFGDSKDEPVEGKIKEINNDSLKIEVSPGQNRVLTNQMLNQIKFKVRDDKSYLSKVAVEDAYTWSEEEDGESEEPEYDQAFIYFGAPYHELMMDGSGEHSDMIMEFMEGSGKTGEELMKVPMAAGHIGTVGHYGSMEYVYAFYSDFFSGTANYTALTKEAAEALSKIFKGKIRPATPGENAHLWAGQGDYHTGKKLSYHQLGDCPSSDCDYEFTTEDNKRIENSHGWFTCPQCQRTHNVRTSLGEKR